MTGPAGTAGSRVRAEQPRLGSSGIELERAADRAAAGMGVPRLPGAGQALALGPVDGRGLTDPITARQRLAARFDMSLPDSQRKLEAVVQLAQVADDAGVFLIELAIAFVVNHPAVTSAIIGPRTLEPALRRR